MTYKLPKDCSYSDRLPLNWTELWRLAMLLLWNPRRAKLFRWRIVEFGMEANYHEQRPEHNIPDAGEDV